VISLFHDSRYSTERAVRMFHECVAGARQTGACTHAAVGHRAKLCTICSRAAA
jgi:hypothetical protein